MWDGYQLVAVLVGVGIALFIAETMLPTHGVLGVLGAGAIVCGLIVCTRRNPWAGMTMLIAMIAATPVAWAGFVKFWPRSPMGRRIMLPPTPPQQQELAVRVGQTGVAVSELRPGGLCEFDGTRIESISELGVVRAGTSVKVVALVNQRPMVRVA